MTPDALRATAAQLGMTGNDLADALGVGHRSYWRWLATGRVPHWVAAKLEQIVKERAALNCRHSDPRCIDDPCPHGIWRVLCNPADIVKGEKA